MFFLYEQIKERILLYAKIERGKAVLALMPEMNANKEYRLFWKFEILIKR